MAFQAIEGHGYTVLTTEVQGVNPHVQIYDTNGQTLLSQQPTDNRPLDWTAPTSGIYYLRIQDQVWDGRNWGGRNRIGSYSLQILDDQTNQDNDEFEPDDLITLAKVATDGTVERRNFFPSGDIDWVAFQAIEGHSYTMLFTETQGVNPHIWLYDIDGRTLLREQPRNNLPLRWTAPLSGPYFLRILDHNGTQAFNRIGSYSLLIHDDETKREGDDSFEPDDQKDQAKQIATDGKIQLHNFSPRTDIDWISFQATKDKIYIISFQFKWPIFLEPEFEIYDRDGKTRIRSWTTSVNDWIAPETGTYFLAVQEDDAREGIYGIRILEDGIEIENERPLIPIELNAVVGSQGGTVELSWNAVPGETLGYLIYRDQSNNPYFTTDSEIVIKDLSPHIKYNFALSSVNIYGLTSSGRSEPVEAIPGIGGGSTINHGILLKLVNESSDVEARFNATGQDEPRIIIDYTGLKGRKSLIRFPLKETYIDGFNGGNSYGGENLLYVGGNLEFVRFRKRALLWFDFSTIPADVTISSARLQMHAEYTSGEVNIGAYPILSPWIENVTWNNTPAHGTIISGVTNSSTGPWEWDITNQIQAWVQGKEGPPPAVNIVYGDVSGNGIVMPFDAALILRFRVGAIELTPEQLARADVNGNGTVTEQDAVLILQYGAGFISSFPIEENERAKFVMNSFPKARIYLEKAELAENKAILPVKLNNVPGASSISFTLSHIHESLQKIDINFPHKNQDWISTSHKMDGQIQIVAAGSAPLSSDSTTIYIELTLPNATAPEQKLEYELSEVRVNDISVPIDSKALLKTSTLLQNFPNPFNPETTIQYAVPKSDQVDLSIYNVMGQKITQLVSEYQNQGWYIIIWDGRDSKNIPVASGIYFYSLKTGSERHVRRMLLLR